jgi:histidinol dehydrogenase
MNIFTLQNLDPDQLNALCRRPADRRPDTPAEVRAICDAVRRRGDSALLDLTEHFDGVRPERLRVMPHELERVTRDLSPGRLSALTAAAENIRRFHEAQLTSPEAIETSPGVTCWRERRALESVGLYVPAGSAPLPSTVLMLGIPASVAGCRRIVLCSPPRTSGDLDPLILAAARIAGITEIYRVGGAQAIAALAYGTESVPKVEKIFGPGNRFVTAAKRIVAADPDGCAIDLPAGPSEVLVIADASAPPLFAALELLAQAEHDADAQSVLVATDSETARRILQKVERLLPTISRRSLAEAALAGSFVLIVPTLDRAIEFSNRYAPEHLVLLTEQPERLVPHIRNAGSVFLGPYAPVAAGDYASGTNHTLPTGGAARITGGLSVEDFTKALTFQNITSLGLEGLAETVETLAEAEGLEAHRLSIALRRNGADGR